MSRKDLEEFKPEKLKPGATFSTEVVRPDGYHEVHYYFRDRDDELFFAIAKNHDHGMRARREWQKLKRVKDKKLVQLSLADADLVSAGGRSEGQEP